MEFDQTLGDGTSPWWKDQVEKLVGPYDGTGRPYWKEVSRSEFEDKMISTFSAVREKECTGFWHPSRNRPYSPEVRLGDDYFVIHQESAIYDDFKIDWSSGRTRYYLHNYRFAV
jgi:hypothetical protein